MNLLHTVPQILLAADFYSEVESFVKLNLKCATFFRVLLGVNPSTGSKVARSRGKKARSGVHDLVLALVRDLAIFSDLEK